MNETVSLFQSAFSLVNNGDCWLDCDEELYIEGQAALI